MKEPLTMVEMEQLAERIAMARFVCRTGKMPKPTDISDERREMFNDAVRGGRVMPAMSRTEAAVWLGSMQLDLPEYRPRTPGDPLLQTAIAYSDKAPAASAGTVPQKA